MFLTIFQLPFHRAHLFSVAIMKHVMCVSVMSCYVIYFTHIVTRPIFRYSHMSSAQRKKPAIQHIAQRKKPAIFDFFLFCNLSIWHQQTSWDVFFMYFTCLKMISKNSYPKKIFVSYVFLHILLFLIFLLKKKTVVFLVFQIPNPQLLYVGVILL